MLFLLFLDCKTNSAVEEFDLGKQNGVRLRDLGCFCISDSGYLRAQLNILRE